MIGQLLGTLIPLLVDIIFETTTTTTQANADILSSILPNWARTAAILLGGGLATYIYRQRRERKKLEKALKTEIWSMDGLETCANSMEGLSKPSETNQGLRPKDVPTRESIPTRIFEDNTQRLGLLKEDDLTTFVRFYSTVIRYKETIGAIRSGEEVPEPDENELWEEVEELEEDRQQLFGDDWLDDVSKDGSN